MQEEDHRKLLAAGCAAVFEPASLYHSGITQHVFIALARIYSSNCIGYACMSRKVAELHSLLSMHNMVSIAVQNHVHAALGHVNV